MTAGKATFSILEIAAFTPKAARSWAEAWQCVVDEYPGEVFMACPKLQYTKNVHDGEEVGELSQGPRFYFGWKEMQ